MARTNEVHTWGSKQRGTVYLYPPPFRPDLVSRLWYIIVHSTWMDLDGIRFSEIVRQRNMNTVWYHLYVESYQIQQTSEYNKKEANSQL